MSKKTERIYGIHAVEQLLNRSPEKVLHAWIQQPHDSEHLRDVYRLLKSLSIATETVGRKSLDKMVNGRHQGVVIETRASKGHMEQDLSAVLTANADNNPLYLVLDSVQDPHNLGACIRTAVAAGVTAVIIPRDRAAGINETVRKVASGAVEDMTIISVVNLARAMQEMKQAGVWLVGMSGEAEQSIYDIDMTTATAIIMGGEEKGLRSRVEKECDYLAAIPLLGSIESLNVSVAAGVSLYEVVRQRQAAK